MARFSRLFWVKSGQRIGEAARPFGFSPAQLVSKCQVGMALWRSAQAFAERFQEKKRLGPTKKHEKTAEEKTRRNLEQAKRLETQLRVTTLRIWWRQPFGCACQSAGENRVFIPRCPVSGSSSLQGQETPRRRDELFRPGLVWTSSSRRSTNLQAVKPPSSGRWERERIRGSGCARGL